jgi:hypothetical protein
MGSTTGSSRIGTSPPAPTGIHSSLPILLVFLTFPVFTSVVRAEISSSLTPLPNHLFRSDLTLLSGGMNSGMSGINRIWYRDPRDSSSSSHFSRISRFFKLDLNHTSRASPIMGTMPTKTSIITFTNCTSAFCPDPKQELAHHVRKDIEGYTKDE